MYVGGSLTSFFGKGPQAATVDAARAMARKGADRMHEVAAENTPVRTGNLRTAWYQLPVIEVDYLLGMGYRSGIANDVEYAKWVESGTGIYGPEHRPYVIVPKDPNGVLAWRDPKTGKWIHAKKVIHPGSPGNHMLALAAHVVEAEVEGGPIFQRILDEWVAIVEGSAH